MLIERERELEVLEAALGALLGGEGTAIAIEGRPGLGKTSLLAHLEARGANAGCRVLKAAGMQLEQQLGWSAVTTLLAPAVPRSATGAPQLEGAAGPAASLFGVEHGAPSIRAMLHALTWLVTDLAAERPLVLVLDDLHWVDDLSARWVAHVIGRLEELPVLVALGARPHRSSLHWQTITADPRTRVLNLAPLTPTGSSSVVSVVFGEPVEPSFADACHATSSGNPFLLRELLRHLQRAAGPGEPLEAEMLEGLRPESVERAVLLRLAELGDAATRVAFAVAVLGAQAKTPLVAELVGMSPSSAAAQVDALVAADLLRLDVQLAFVHPIVARVVADEVPVATARALHRQAAQLLLARGGRLEDAAAHLLESEPAADAEVVAVLRRAAAEAMRTGAADTAAAFLRRALLESPPASELPELLWEIARAEVAAGPAVAVPRYLQALELQVDPAARARVTLELSEQLVLQADPHQAVSHLQAALRDLPASESELHLRLSATALALSALEVDDPPPLPNGVTALEGGTFGERIMLAAAVNAMMVTGTYPMPEIAELGRRALHGGRLASEVPLTNTLYWSVVSALTVAEAPDDAGLGIEAALRVTRVHSSPDWYAIACCFRSALEYRLGHLPEAVADGERAVELVDPRQSALAYLYSLSFLVNALVARGETERAEQLIGAFPLDESPRLVVFGLLLGGRGRLRVAQGRLTEAIADLRSAGARLGRLSSAVLPWRAEAAIALARLGDRAEALELAREDLARCERSRSVSAQAIALRALAAAEGTLEPLERAEQLTRGHHSILERARVLLELGAGQRRARGNRGAQAWLREALDLADRCGAVPLAERARAELRTAGARPRRERISGRESLTPSEQRVCALAAQGRTNREIAQSLFVSLRTVETHLTHAFQKLDIAGRADLDAALDEESPAPS